MRQSAFSYFFRTGIGLSCIFWGLFHYSSRAQSAIDSLKSVIRKESNDSIKSDYYNDLAFAYWETGDFSQAVAAANHSLEIASRKGYIAPSVNALNSLGIIYDEYGNFDKAIEYFEDALKLCNRPDLLEKKAHTLNNLGIVYDEKGIFAKSLTYYFQSLLILEKIGDQRGIADTYQNIGLIYKSQKDFKKGINIFEKSLRIFENLNDIKSQATACNNLGIVYQELKDYKNAIYYYRKSLRLRKILGLKAKVGQSFNNMAAVYLSMDSINKSSSHENMVISARLKKDFAGQNLLDSALWYATAGFNLNTEIHNDQSLCISIMNLGGISYIKGDFKQALEYFNRASALARELNSKALQTESAKFLALIHYHNGNPQVAYEWMRSYSELKDTLFKREQQKEMGKQEGIYETSKQIIIEQKEYEKKIALEKEKQSKQRLIIYGSLLILAIIVFFAFILYNRILILRKQKIIIQTQKNRVDDAFYKLSEKNKLIEEKSREITDSMEYARRLQNAILPSEKLFRKYLPESFIFYRPKEIVAGDFYWLADNFSVKSGKGKSGIYFAAADCTGHGVPGALVSVVCSNALNRVINENQLEDTGDILDRVRTLVVETFEKSENEVKDGMDISLMRILPAPPESAVRAVQWSGANNPVWIISSLSKLHYRNGGEITGKPLEGKDKYFYELKPNKQPIGKSDRIQPFTTHDFKLCEGDGIYIFTDGYADQFGGEKGKKFKHAQFKTLLFSISDLPMHDQLRKLQRAFDNWKSGLEQVDDVCIIGVKVI